MSKARTSKHDEQYRQKILNGWEEIYRRGQLTFWVLLSLKESAKYCADLRVWLEHNTNNTLVPEERSLYRSLQRLYDAELLSSVSEPSEKGPDRKIYSLSELGADVLASFIERNIALFYVPSIKKIIEQ